MDLRGSRANIHLQFSKITASKNISILLQLGRSIKKKKRRKKKSSLSDQSEALMATNAYNINFALLRFTHSLISLANILQIKTDITGSLKLIAKGCLTITLSISSPGLFPLTASSSVFQPAVKPAFSLFSPFKAEDCRGFWCIRTDFIKQLNPSLPA